MNRIYRVIWSHARHCYVVVSELAKRHQRPGTIGSISIAALAVVTLLCSTSFAAKGEGEASKQWGINTVASGEYATAWGRGTQATGQGATAFGYKTTASGIRATAFGEEAVASGTNATAWGEKSKASGYTSTAFGYKTTASDSYATAFGNETTASNYAATAFGYKTTASNMYATAFGNGTTASNYATTAFGYETTASGSYATAFGNGTTANGAISTSFGQGTTASGNLSTAFGQNTTASGSYTTAFGNGTKASDSYATAFGYETTASNMYATAFGKETKASGYTSTALGYNTTASGSYATAFGNGTTANGDMSTSFGQGTSASGNLSTAFGQNTTASGFGATAFGEGTVASGTNAAALGYKTIASGKYATAFGNESKAYGKNSFAVLGGIVGLEGNGESSSNSAAIGNGATVLVSDTLALGSGSVADRDVKTYAKEGTFSPVTRDIDIPTWKGTANAIAIGDAKNGVTRQLTGLAAGSEDTDAVNVAQLKAVSADSAGKTGDLQYTSAKYVAKGDNLTVAVGKLDNQVNVNTTAISTNTTDITTLNNHVGIGTVLQAGNAANLTTAVNMNYRGIQVLNQYAGIEKQLNAGNAIDLTEGVNNAYAKALEASGEAVKHTTVSAKDDNIVINTTTNEDGSKNYDVSLNPVVNLAEVTAGKGTLGGVTMADGIASGTDFTTTYKGNTVSLNDVYNRTSQIKKTDDYTTIIGDTVAVRAVGGTHKGGIFIKGIVDGNAVTMTQFLEDGSAVIGKVGVGADGKISGVAAGTEGTDAVNYNQLKAVQTEAGKHSVVKAGDKNLVVTDTKTDGQHEYAVSLGKDITLEGTLTAANASLKGLTVDGGTVLRNGGTSFTVNNTGVFAQAGSTSVTMTSSGVNVIAPTTQVTGNANVVGKLSENGVQVATKDDIKAVDKDLSGLSGKLDNVSNKVDSLDKTVTNQGEAIKDLQKDTAQNKQDIAQNKNDIAQNKENIAANKTQIDKNTSDIAANKDQIDKNTAAIEQNKQDIAANKAQIDKNTAAIDKNTSDIAKNTEQINKNAEKIQSNTERIDGLEKSNSATNEQVKKNTEAINQNKADIQANKDAIALEVKNRENAVKDEALKRETEDKALSGRINANKTVIDKHTELIGATGENGTLKLQNGETTVEAGINKNTADIKVNADNIAKNAVAIEDNSKAISFLGTTVHKLDRRIDQVGAGAAALAALHPLDYDPLNKWDFAAGYGNYRGASAVAIGTYYRPNENTMLSLGGSFGSGENMVNAGVSFKVGAGSSAVLPSRTVMAKEMARQADEIKELKELVQQLLEQK